MKFIFSALILLTSLTMMAQQQTIIFLTRHAEKDMAASSNDPALSGQGTEAAARLGEMLKDAGITAIYATETKRAVLTAQPLADSLRCKINHYKDINAEAGNWLKTHAGKRILVVGHSNTVPMLLNQLAGKEKYSPNEDYGNLFMLIVEGKKLKEVILFKY